MCQTISLNPSIVIQEREFQVNLPSGEKINLIRKNFEDVLAFSIENSGGEAIFSVSKGLVMGSISGWKDGRWLIEPCLGLGKVEKLIKYCHTIRFKNKIKDKKNDIRGAKDEKRKLTYIKRYKGDYLCTNGKLSINRQYCCSNLCKNECISDRSTPCVAPCCGYEIADKKSCFNFQAPCNMMAIQTLSIGYTAETVLKVHGKLETLQAIIRLAVDEVNTAYLNSRIPIKMILVDVYQVDFEEQYIYMEPSVDEEEIFSSFVNELSMLNPNNQANYHILIYSESFAMCGIADIVDCIQNDCNFALVAFDCLLGQYTLAHEIGHLQGASHDVATEHGTSFRFPNAYGYRFYPFCTIMAYCSEDTVINYFSNPDVTVRGFATGTSNADNSFALLATRYEHSNMNYSSFVSYLPTSSPTTTWTKTISPTMPSKKPTSKPTRQYGEPLQGEFCFDGQDPLMFPHQFSRNIVSDCEYDESHTGYFAYKKFTFKMRKESRSILIDFQQNTCAGRLYFSIHSSFNPSSICSSYIYFGDGIRDVHENLDIPPKVDIVVNSILRSNSNFTEDSKLRCCFSLGIKTTPLTLSPTKSPTNLHPLSNYMVLLPSLLHMDNVAQVLYTCRVGSLKCKTINNCGGSKYVVSYRYTIPIDGIFEFKANPGRGVDELTTCRSPILYIAPLNICATTNSIMRKMKAGTNLTLFMGSESDSCEFGKSVALSIHHSFPSPTNSPMEMTKAPSSSPTQSSSPTSSLTSPPTSVPSLRPTSIPTLFHTPSPLGIEPTSSPKALKTISPTKRKPVFIKKLPSSTIVKPTPQTFWTCDVEKDQACHFAFNCVPLRKYITKVVIYEYTAPRSGFYRFYTANGGCADTAIVLNTGECNDDRVESEDYSERDYHSEVISRVKKHETVRIIVGGLGESYWINCVKGSKIFLGVSLVSIPKTDSPTKFPTFPPFQFTPVDLPSTDIVEYTRPTNVSFCYTWKTWDDDYYYSYYYSGPDEDHYTDSYGNTFPYCPTPIRYPGWSGVQASFKYTAPFDGVFTVKLSVDNSYCYETQLFLDIGQLFRASFTDINIALKKGQVFNVYAIAFGWDWDICLESLKLGVYEISKKLTLSPTSSPTFRCQSDTTIGKKECEANQKKCGKKLKWAGEACTNSTIPDAGCQCKGYCGYTCNEACWRDSECYWKSGACYVKKTEKKGVPQKEC